MKRPDITDLRVLDRRLGVWPLTRAGYEKRKQELEEIVEPFVTDIETKPVLSFQGRTCYLSDAAPDIAWEAARGLQYLYPLLELLGSPDADQETLVNLAYGFAFHDSEVEHQGIFERSSIEGTLDSVRHSAAQAGAGAEEKPADR